MSNSYLARSAAPQLASRIFGVASALTLTSLLLDMLGDEQYGLWVVLISVAAYASVADVGVAAGLARHVAIGHGAEDEESIRSVLTVSLFFYTTVGAVVSALLVAFAGPIAGMFGATEALEQVRLGLLLAGLSWTFTSLAHVWIAGLEGTGRMPRAATIRSAAPLLHLGGVVAATRLDATVRGAMAGSAVAALLYALLARAASRGVLPSVRLIPDRHQTSWLRHVVAYGGKLHVITISVLAREHTDRVVIASVLALATVADYHIAYRVAALVILLPEILLSTAAPLAAAAYGTGQPWGLERLEALGRAVIVVSVATLGALAMGFPHLMHGWLGSDRPDSFLLFLMLGAAAALNNATGVMTIELRTRAQLRPEVAGAVAVMVANLPLTVGMAYLWGATGVVAATALATATGVVVYTCGAGRRYRAHIMRQGLVLMKSGLVAMFSAGVVLVPSRALAELPDTRLEAALVAVAIAGLFLVVYVVIAVVTRTIGIPDAVTALRLYRPLAEEGRMASPADMEGAVLGRGAGT